MLLLHAFRRLRGTFAQADEPMPGRFQRLGSLGKVETNQIVHRLTEEAGARNRGHADLLDQPGRNLRRGGRLPLPCQWNVLRGLLLRGFDTDHPDMRQLDLRATRAGRLWRGGRRRYRRNAGVQLTMRAPWH